MDLLVVLVMYLLMIPTISDSNLGFVRVLRLGRTLRPLRMINRNKGMRVCSRPRPAPAGTAVAHG
jgi:hypothetical protein